MRSRALSRQKNRTQPARDRERTGSRTGRGLARQRYLAIRNPHKAVLDHGVAAAMFGGIERGVGGLDQVARPLRVVRLGAGYANADGDGFIAGGAVWHREVLDLSL